MDKGYVQVYTGDGKGKTTAALGLGLRAAGGGFKVIMFQFLKGAHSGELDSVSCLGGSFQIIRLAETRKFFGSMDESEKEELRKRLQTELEQVKAVISAESCDILILDEIMAVLHGKLLTVEEVCSLIDARPAGMELILTGRAAPPDILARADLVTEMRCIKHYMDAGVNARQGIEK
ncbi:MAG: cob(I)yrinic acid a,c-diamide adenosyltransferase [Dethiobacteria bacterium]|nr:cob(I)yrinic acid a,c-diamide adenosyltransferase [Bacillota bacterium]